MIHTHATAAPVAQFPEQAPDMERLEGELAFARVDSTERVRLATDEMEMIDAMLTELLG